MRLRGEETGGSRVGRAVGEEYPLVPKAELDAETDCNIPEGQVSRFLRMVTSANGTIWNFPHQLQRERRKISVIRTRSR